MNFIKNIPSILSFLSNSATLVASSIAICIYVFKRNYIKNVFDILINYTNQITFSEIYSKLDNLNNLNADEEAHKNNVLNILNEIRGQIKGNKLLKNICMEKIKDIDKLTKNPLLLKETTKRSLIFELRENLRNINATNYKDFIRR